jgi:hypothetical protein
LFLQQLADDRVADLVPEIAKFIREPAQALAGTVQWRHRIAPRVGLDQYIQIVEQTRVRFGQRFAAHGVLSAPRPIVLAAMRVTRETAAMPPCPAARASEAAKSRRCRSSNRGNIAAWRVSSFRKESSSTIPYDTTPNLQRVT